MTDQEREALFRLVNGWEEAAKTFERSMRRHRSLADYWQKKSDHQQGQLLLDLAAADEIRAGMLRNNARMLALKIGELAAPLTATPSKSKRKRMKYA